MCGQAKFQKTLADCIRTGDKTEFRQAFDSFKDVRNLATDLIAGNSATRGASKPFAETASTHTAFPSFLDRIQRQSRDQVLQFLADITSNEDFLVQRLMSLDQQQLEYIQQGAKLSSHDQSVLGHTAPSVLRRVSSPGSQYDGRQNLQVNELCRRDPFALLLDLVGLYPAANSSALRRRQERIWAGVCASMLSENRPGREKFIISVLDGLAYEIQPTGRRALETWIQETLRDGQFLLSRSEQPSFGARSQQAHGEHGTVPPDPEVFYFGAVKKLLACLKNNQQTKIIPQRVLNTCRLTVEKLRGSDTKFRTAPFFFLAHWLFSTFLIDEIIIPESRGLMLGEYFPETARHRVLRETILRAQRLVVDVSYAWNHTGAVDPAMKAEIEAIAAMFRPEPRGQTLNDNYDHDDRISTNDYFLRSLSVLDIHTLVSALYPDKLPQSGSLSLPLKMASTSHASSTSSLSGLSIFRQTPIDEEDPPPIPGTESGLSTDSDVQVYSPVSPIPINAAKETIAKADSNPSQRTEMLRLACKEISTITKTDIMLPAARPDRDTWSLLEIRKGTVRNLDQVHTSTKEQLQSETAMEEDASGSFWKDADSRSSYHRIRKSVLRLMGDAGLMGIQPSPVELDCSAVLGPSQKYRLPYDPFSTQLESPDKSETNPYRRQTSSVPSSSQSESFNLPLQGTRGSLWPESLSGMLEEAIRHLHREEDFTKALELSQILDEVRALTRSNDDDEATLLRFFIRDVSNSMSRSRNTSARLETLASQLEQQCLEADVWTKVISAIANETRVKMWYCTDVRTAACYSDLEKLASAIRSMGLPSQSSLKRADPPTLRHKGTLKPKNLNAVKKGEASVLDIMVTDPSLQLLCKLKDEQVSLTQLWMEKAGIENICAGEERLHRLLCEMAKCLNVLISADPMISPVLWGSELFQRDKWDGENEAIQIDIANNEAREHMSTFSRPSSNGSEFVFGDPISRMRRPSDFNIAAAGFYNHDLGSDTVDGRSPTLLTRSSLTFWSPSGFRSQSPLSNVSPPSRTWSPMYLRQSMSRESFQTTPKVQGLLTDLRLSMTGLLVSDVLRSVFPNGSETDQSFFHGVGNGVLDQLGDASPEMSMGGRFAEATKRTDKQAKRDSKVSRQSSRSSNESSRGDHRKISPASANTHSSIAASIFDLDHAKRLLVRRFDLSGGPYEKLKTLHDLEGLLMSSHNRNGRSPAAVQEGSQTPRTVKMGQTDELDILRTRLETSLLVGRTGEQLRASVRAFEDLFRDPTTRPTYLFRDLQAIAALMPPETLDESPQGQTFWSVTIAALSMKENMTRLLVEKADQIIDLHTSAAAQKATTSTHSMSMTAPTMVVPGVPANDIEAHPLMQAFRLLHLAAAQSHPVAQRELATLYLTHPDLLPRVLAPFAKCKDAFRTTQATQWAREKGDGRKYDAETMSIALHWMELSAAGGDQLAKGFGEVKT